MVKRNKKSVSIFFRAEQQIIKVLVYILHKDLLISILLGVVLIIVGVTLGYENLQQVPANHHLIDLYRAEPHNKLSFMSNWDGPIYIQIANHGYTNQQLTNFFPLYPLLTRIVNFVISSPLYSALVVAWISLIGAIYYYIKIVKEYFKTSDNGEAVKAALLFIAFPSAVFLLATFTESLFAFASLAAIYYALKNRYILAGFLAIFATATRLNGIFIVLLIAMILLENKREVYHAFVTSAIGSIGILAYMIYLYTKYHNPALFLVTQRGHGWLHHILFLNSQNYSPMNIIFLIPIVMAIVYWWSRKKSFAIYSILFLLIPILGGQFGGFARYTLMDFPIFLMLYGYLKDKAVMYSVIMLILGIGWTYVLLQYTGGYLGG